MCKITNGAFVNRMWGALGDGDVIGHFGYVGDAQAFAKMCAASGKPAPECWWVVSDAQSGEVFVYRPEAAAPADASAVAA